MEKAHSEDSFSPLSRDGAGALLRPVQGCAVGALDALWHPVRQDCAFLHVLPVPHPVLAFDKYTRTPRSTFLFAGITFLVGVALACGTEWGQAHLTTYRSGDPLDLLADVSALFIGTLIVIVWDIRKQK